jgi:dipeptidyl aminopeptidase/acylaminoacyl peptidase
MKRLPLVVILLLPALPARPAAPPPTPFDPWSVDDVALAESASDFQCSPNGRVAVWVKSCPDREKNELVGNLFRLDLRTAREVQLTRSPESCLKPRWSPDGKLLAFLSTRQPPKTKPEAPAKEDKSDEPKPQLWLLDPTGGEPWPLTELARGVLHYGWAGPDSLVFAAQEEPARRESLLKDDPRDTSVPVEDEKAEPPVRLFRVDVRSKKLTRLTTNPDRIDLLAVSPDGRYAAALHQRSLRYTYDNKVRPAVFLHDLSARTRKQIFTQKGLNVSHLAWAPDARTLYATSEHNSRPPLNQAGVTEVYSHDLPSGDTRRVDLGWPNGLSHQPSNADAPGLVPVRGGFLALLARGARPRAARFTRAGDSWRRQWLTGEHAGHLFGLAAGPDGTTLLYAHSTASRPTRWYHARLDGARIVSPKPFAPFNEHLARRRKARAEVVRWKGAGADEVEGILYYPHGYRPGTRHPLVVMIHGGPAGADHDAWEERWSYAPNLLCQRGAFVLKPNYHGSSGYGLKWLESITNGKYAGPELEDVEKGVDALVARGLVDGKRLGLYGWSNGAILTFHLVARTTRYRAAVAGAGSTEYVSDWSSCEFGEAFDRYYLGKSPFDDLSLYLHKSPFYRLDRVRTPTLILHGTEDRVVATQQGWAQFRGLQQLGKAPVRFVLFPGEKHELLKLGHRRRKLREELAWFDRHLFGKAPPDDEVVKDDSPLAWALKRAKARRHGGRYGVLLRGVLAPEIVSFRGLRVGRFEVTRAQFAQFDRGTTFEPGQADLPASGITFAQASAYCRWLSKATGRAFRLPTAEEAETLYDRGGSGENTLDHWAGYAVNPEDCAPLRDKVKALPGPAPLLRSVGSFRAAGKEGVFDLGGNVAEWVSGPGGKGVLRGGSADTPADPRGRTIEPGPEYRGFRVVEGR